MALWIKIENFDIDGEKVEFPFVRRLAKGQGWSLAYANRVIEEYRRFVFLAMAAEHPVSPSQDVDEAWHLHLTYTHSYWERLSKEVLPRPLHHSPTKGGKAEDAKHTDWYARTREDYQRFFGAPPPSDIWPASNLTKSVKSKTIDASANWVIRKSSVKRAGKIALAGAAGAGLAAGCMPLLGQTGGSFPVLWVILAGAGVVILGGIFWAMQSFGSNADAMNPMNPMQPGGPNDPHDPRRDPHTGAYGTGCAGGGGFVDHGTHHSSDSNHDSGSSDSGGGDSSGGDSGGSSCSGGGCGGGGCSS